MTPPSVIRRLLLPVLASAAVWSIVTPASAIDCEDIAAYQKAVGPGPGSNPGLSVGVAIHIMERPGHACEVRKVWTSEQVTTIFAAGSQDQQNVNSIWSSTRIRFTVHEVVLSEVDPPEGMMDPLKRIILPGPGPRGTVEYEHAFDLLVSGRHRDRKVNVYLWRRLSGEPVGFGRSIRSGHGKATVFLDNQCGTETLRKCAAYAAHELGHTMGLYHAGRGTCGKIPPPFDILCAELAVPCVGIALHDRLMTPRAVGRKLCPVEVKNAELMAKDEFQ